MRGVVFPLCSFYSFVAVESDTTMAIAELLGGWLRQIPLVINNENSTRVQPTELIKKEEILVRTPWQVLEGSCSRDQQTTRAIRSSFNPMFFVGGGNFVPLSDIGEGSVVCCGKECEDETSGQPSIWLNPEKWKDAIHDFLEFASQFNTSLRFLVCSHNQDKEYESIVLSPIHVDSHSGYQRSPFSYGLNPEGELWLGNEAASYDLGLLNPERALGAKREALLLFLLSKHPTIG